jgi:LPS-assembly protein
VGNGSYYIRAAGISQWDKSYFLRDDGTPTPGYRRFRGTLESSGQFALNSRWVFGWDLMMPSDKSFYQDYDLLRIQRINSIYTGPITEGVSQAYLSGRGATSYFDIRSIYFYGFSEFDRQAQIPIIHPVMDYSYKFAQPVLGGELGYRVNTTSLTRSAADFNPVSTQALNNGWCLPTTADPAVKAPANCLLRGFPGTYSRASVETTWRKTIVDTFGQIFTPFISMRADAATLSVRTEPGVQNYLPAGQSTVIRGMPTVGIEYRYPFISAQSWGTQTLEPIVQVIARPNETQIGRLPNEDAQSLIFDDTKLFAVDKFSGWDRAEGGGRANVGVQYTAQFNRAGTVNALLGQSYQLFGLNSYTVRDVANTGVASGLETTRSDYVARLSYEPNRTYALITRYQFDQADFAVRRFEVEGRANFDRWTFGMVYGRYAAQPQIGYLTPREGVLGTALMKLTSEWALFGGARYDIQAKKFASRQIGIGYVDDCLILALNYMTDYTYSNNPQVDHRVMLQMSLRTLGGTTVSRSVGGLPRT